MFEEMLMILNNSKIFGGCMMLMMNIGAKYIVLDIPKEADEIFKTVWMRRLIIFAVSFIATRDIKTAILITLVFMLIFKFLLNKKSKSCILQNK